ncbi:MAG TPA: hypothetical protein VEY67_10340, partial [Candidatus Dormibacteraeota bacterium]|nr:hypothetical protein [Candidatus Dormibacteraeota bacterium]
GSRASLDAATCATCGASLARRESIGDVAIPGVTAVDPALVAVDGKPVHIRPAGPTHGIAAGIIPALALGGPVGLVALGGIAAVAAAEYRGASGDGGETRDPATVGDLSEVARLAVERLDRGELGAPGQVRADAEDADPAAAPDPWRDLPHG